MNGVKLTVCLAILLAGSFLALPAGLKFPPAEIQSATALVSNDCVNICWRTAGESGVVSFDLYRRQNGGQGWVKVNDFAVVCSNSIAGASYAVADTGAAPFQKNVYRLVQRDRGGNITPLSSIELTSALPVDSAPVANAAVISTPTGTVAPIGKPLGMVSLASLNGSTFVKITTTNSGLQYVDANALATLLGQPLATVESAIAQGQFQLTSSGQPVTWLPSPGASNLLFYAEAHKDNYSTNNVYWLTSQANGVMGGENGQAPSPTSAALWYPAPLFHEVYSYYEGSLPLTAEADPWMTYQLLAIPVVGFNTVNYFAGLDHLTQGSDRSAQLSLQLWGGVAGLTNIIQITVNTNTVLGQWSWAGLTPTNLVVTIPSADLISGSNKLALTAVSTPASSGGEWYVNNFTLSWPRTYTAVNGIVDFTANSNAVVSVNGFTGTNITLLDVTNPKLPLLVTNVTLDQPSTWRLSFVPASPAAHYVAFQSGTAAPAYLLALGYVGGFSSSANAADYVIVSPPSLLTAATNLAAYRQQTGLKTIIAPLDEVYNEFGYGFPTPHAIQGLLATAWTNWSTAPHYVVLLGRGTYDFLNVKQQNDNLTPPLMVSTPFGVFASDSLMGVTTTNGLPEVAVGRLSGLTTNDMQNLLGKIKNYESLPPPAAPQALLIADEPDGAGNFQNEVQQLDAILTNKFTDTILFSTNSTNGAPLHAQILAGWSQGADFVNYSGHGAIDQFGTYAYLAATDITNSALANCPRLPFVTAMTCVSGQYSQPGVDSLGEYLLQPAAGGAIAFYGPTGLSLSGEASELNVRLTTLLRANGLLALGDLIRQAVSDHVTQDLPTIPVWIYNLMGDPALHYNLARNLSPLQITTVTPKTIIWSGSLPPYQVQYSTSLSGGAVWQPVTPQMIGNQVTLSLTNAGTMGFLRVQGSQ